MRWDILTGEYPPQPGGVSDYTSQVARALAAAGDEVHVWAPAWPGIPEHSPGVQVHRLPGPFGTAALRVLAAGLATSSARIILLQYVPQAFGYKGANLLFCLWLWTRRRDTIWTLFHEAVVPFDSKSSLKSNLLAVITRIMAALIARASQRIFVSTPAWKPVLRRLTARSPEWLPVPSNLPVQVDPIQARDLRARLAPEPRSILIGNFGSYSTLIAPLLSSWFQELLSRDDRAVGLLIGHRAASYASGMERSHPWMKGRLRIADGLPPMETALHLAACDLMAQPYPDGITTRRSTLMASLALGKPVITNSGHLTEPFWSLSEAVVLMDLDAPDTLPAAARALLNDPEARARLGARAAAFHNDRFALEHVIAKLRLDARAAGLGPVS